MDPQLPTEEDTPQRLHSCPHCGASADAPGAIPPTKLSARQEKFVQGYVTGLSATKAYQAAYGNSRGADVSASRLLSSAKVSARLHELQQKQILSTLMTRDQIRHYLYRVVFTPIGAVDHTSNLCQSYRAKGLTGSAADGERGQVELPGGQRARKLFNLQITMPDKLRAIELDAKLTGELYNPPPPKEETDPLKELLLQIRAGR